LAIASACSASKVFDLGMAGAEAAVDAEARGPVFAAEGSLAGAQPTSITEAIAIARIGGQ